MYFFDFLKNLFKKNNIGILIWLVLNTALMTVVLGYCFYDSIPPEYPQWLSFFIGAGIYLVSIIIALSPIGEFILRLQTGCHRVTDQEIINRIDPIFNEVYAKAKAANPELHSNIKYYMSNDSDPNAFATGRRTVCFTRGILNYSDDELRAVLGHEFGHLAHKDTDAILVVTVGNLIVSAIFVCWRVFFNICARLFNFALSIAIDSLGTLIATIITRIFIDFLLVTIMNLWTKLGALLCLSASRKNEFRADEYSYNMGYGYSLCAFLDRLDPSTVSKRGLWATLNSSHPETSERIQNLQLKGCTYYRY